MQVRRSSRHGLTLVEILIALVLFVFAALTTVASVIVSNRISSSNSQHARATAFAEEWAEQIIASPFSDIVYGAHLPTMPAGVTLPADNSLQAFTGVGDMGDNAQWSMDISTSLDGLYRLVVLTVRWENPVTERLIERDFRFYRYDDQIVTYPYRPPAS